MATKQKYKSTADVLKTILADSASEDDDSRELSSETEFSQSQSSADSSDGDEDLSNGESSVSAARKRKLARPAGSVSAVDGGWTDNTPQDTVDTLVFTDNSGCLTPLQSEEPLEFFEQFVITQFVSDCVTETNRYASQMSSSAELSHFSRMRSWAETKVFELFLYFGLLVLMGIDRRPKLSMYWSREFFVNTPAFPALMSRDRFLLIRRFLDFVDNSGYQRGVSGKLFKIKPVLEYIQSKIESLFHPGKFFAVDESLLLWKGRLSWKQYIPKKRSRFGIKSFELCDCSTSYLWNFIIYSGRETDLDADNVHSQGTKVVMKLANDLLGVGRCCVTDNFYSSPELFGLLQDGNTDAFGTCRTNRKGMSSVLSHAKLKKGDVVTKRKGRFLAVRWKDKRDVCMLSTYHQGIMADSGKKDKEGNSIQKPDVVLEYNNVMGAVDKVDQMLEPYAVQRKGLKWYLKLFEHLLDVAVFNSFVLYKQCNVNSKLAFLDYKMLLVDNIVTKYYFGGTASARGLLADCPLRLTGRHFPSHIPASGKKSQPTRKCKVCSSAKMRHETRYMCLDCGSVPLCVDPCFRLYHSVKFYDVARSSGTDPDSSE